jgi:hypothetical protein
MDIWDVPALHEINRTWQQHLHDATSWRDDQTETDRVKISSNEDFAG